MDPWDSGKQGVHGTLGKIICLKPKEFWVQSRKSFTFLGYSGAEKKNQVFSQEGKKM